VDNRTRDGEHRKPGVPDKGDRMDAAPVREGNESGKKETCERQDPQVHDERFTKDQIKRDFLQHRQITTTEPCIWGCMPQE